MVVSFTKIVIKLVYSNHKRGVAAPWRKVGCKRYLSVEVYLRIYFGKLDLRFSLLFLT